MPHTDFNKVLVVFSAVKRSLNDLEQNKELSFAADILG